MSIPNLSLFMESLRQQAHADPHTMAEAIREGLNALERSEPQAAQRFKRRITEENGEVFFLGACRNVLELALLFEGEVMLERKGQAIWVEPFIDLFFEETQIDVDVKPILKSITRIEYNGHYLKNIERRLL